MRPPGKVMNTVRMVLAIFVFFVAVTAGAPSSVRAGIPEAAVSVPGRFASPPQKVSRERAKAHRLLKDILKAVKDFGRYPGEDFLRREFFIGEDDDDTNKNDHLVVIVQDLRHGKRMTLQVTHLEPSPGNPRIKNSTWSKTLICVLEGDRVEIERSEFEEKDLPPVLAGVLKAITDKKRLMG